jgi:hypothetical protein
VFDQITPAKGEPRELRTWSFQGWAHGPASESSSTAQPGGAVYLVTPNQIRTNLPYGSSDKMASIVTMVIHFIPEPGLLLMLSSGVAGLVILGRKRFRE